ncbi:hypothetical protein Celaphus_00013589, partial [Cervus elaphus hippelaphus]
HRKQIGWHGLSYHHVLQDVNDELASVDVDEGKLNDETPDLEHGSPFMKMPNAVCRKGYLVTADSSLKLGVHSESCHGWILGKRGDSSVPVWSGVIIVDDPQKDLNSDIKTDKDHE